MEPKHTEHAYQSHPPIIKCALPPVQYVERKINMKPSDPPEIPKLPIYGVVNRKHLRYVATQIFVSRTDVHSVQS